MSEFTRLYPVDIGPDKHIFEQKKCKFFLIHLLGAQKDCLIYSKDFQIIAHFTGA